MLACCRVGSFTAIEYGICFCLSRSTRSGPELETRNGFPNWFSSYLTEKYLFHAANFLTNKSAVVVTYDGLLSQPYEELSPVIDRLQSDSTSKIPGEGVFAELIDEALYRSRNDQRDIQLGAGLLQKHFLFSGSANQKITHRDLQYLLQTSLKANFLTAFTSLG